VTFLVTTVAWVYFRAPDVAAANLMIGTMFGIGAAPGGAPLSGYVIVLALLAMHWVEAWGIANLDRVAVRVGDRWMRLPGPVQALAAFPVLFFIVAITKVGRGAFIYFQF
jgi:hypothetical protein